MCLLEKAIIENKLQIDHLIMYCTWREHSSLVEVIFFMHEICDRYICKDITLQPSQYHQTLHNKWLNLSPKNLSFFPSVCEPLPFAYCLSPYCVSHFNRFCKGFPKGCQGVLESWPWFPAVTLKLSRLPNRPDVLA